MTAPVFILAAVFLGIIGIYCLLPKAGRSSPFLGALFAGAALILCGWRLVQVEAAVPEQILFYAFAGLAIIGGGLLITQQNPVHAALSFALVVLSTCGLFLLQAAPFLMAATIIIYAGAIVVTFLFVIMLAQQAGRADADRRSREPFLATLAGFVLIGALLGVLDRNFNTRELDQLFARLTNITNARDTEDVIVVMGDPATRSPKVPTHPLVERLNVFFPGADPVSNLEIDWLHIREPGHLQKLQGDARGILALIPARRVNQGNLTPSAALPLSNLSGAVSSAALAPDESGVLPERLPARNVAALGVSLFTDYLLAVELAGMLLLVATIGAIAIAGRRTEGFR